MLEAEADPSYWKGAQEHQGAPRAGTDKRDAVALRLGAGVRNQRSRRLAGAFSYL